MNAANNPPEPKDRYGFWIGTQSNKIASMIDNGKTREQIERAGWTNQQISQARYAMKKAGAILPEWPRKPMTRNVNPNKPAKTVTLEELQGALRRPERVSKHGVDKFGFRVTGNRAEIAKLIEQGLPNAAIVNRIGGAISNVIRTRTMVNAALKKAAAAGSRAVATLTPRPPLSAAKPKVPIKNGHDPRGQSFAGVSVPIVELIVHPVDGERVRVFSSVDVFEAIYARVVSITGIK